MKYPGSLTKLIANMIGVDINIEQERASRIPTSILLLTFTITPFILHNYPITILPLAFLGLFEGLVHIFFIKLFKCPKFYSPGIVTAEIQAIVTIILFTYLIKNNMKFAAVFKKFSVIYGYVFIVERTSHFIQKVKIRIKPFYYCVSSYPKYKKEEHQKIFNKFLCQFVCDNICLRR